MINIVFGKPGAGKTAFMVSQALEYLTPGAKNRDLLGACRNDVAAVNSLGYDFPEPDEAPVYSNFPIRAHVGYERYAETFYVDGFHLGFPNPDVKVIPVLPHAVIFLSEAQRYYNSRKSKDLPDWVSRWYEEHRHVDVTVWLDVQRPGLIDLNIRELCGRFFEIEGMENIPDERGTITANKFNVKEFGSWAHVDKYLSSGSADNAERKTYVFKGNVFRAYESRCYFNQFIPKEATYSTLKHTFSDDSVAQTELGRELYSQLPPKGFYK